MKIALAQMEVVPNQPQRNVATMLRMMEKARAQDVGLIAFPEMSVGGYLLGDKWLLDDFCRDLMEHHAPVVDASEGMAVAFGNVFLDDKIHERRGPGHHPNKDGRTRKHNAIYVFQDRRPAPRLQENSILPAGIQPKTLLPNYRFFDDQRYFFSLEDTAKDFGAPLQDLVQPFRIADRAGSMPVGFELCEDLWCMDYRRCGKPVNITQILADKGAQRIVNLSSSPWTFGKNQARDRRVLFLKSEAGPSFVPFLYVNAVGMQNNGKNLITFDGGTTAYGPEGLPVRLASTSYGEELIVVEDQDFERVPVARVEKPKIAQKCEAILCAISRFRDLLGLADHPRFIVGLSGGVDSAVVAALLVRALGSDRVMAVNMPTRHNSAKTRDVAAHVARKLGIRFMELPIESLVHVNEDLLERADLEGDGKALNGPLRENIQAKIRGTSILSNLAGKYGALFVNTGNKLEVALGYCTLYGDVDGAFAPLGDLTKPEIFDLARTLNDDVFHDEVIPNLLLPDGLCRFTKDQIQPSAELKEAQVDPMKFGYHDALLEAMTDYRRKTQEDIMRWYLEGTMEKNLGIPRELIERWGVDDPQEFLRDLDWFCKSMQVNVFKRIQAPPIVVTSKSAFGFDIRESQLPARPSLEEGRLRARLLAMDARYSPGP